MPYAFNSSYNYAPFNSDQLAGYMDRGFGLADSVLALRKQEADRAFQLQQAMQNQQLQGLQQQQQQQQAMFPQQQEAMRIANLNQLFNSPQMQQGRQELERYGMLRFLQNQAYGSSNPMLYSNPLAATANSPVTAAAILSGQPVFGRQ